MKAIRKVLCGCVILASLMPACTAPGNKQAGEPNVPEGVRVLSAVKNSVNDISRMVGPSVAYVEIALTGDRDPDRMTGIFIDAENNMFIPAYLKKDTIRKISVWINKEEYTAKLVQSDDKRYMSIIKVKLPPEVKITPISLEKIAQAGIGEWLIGINTSGKDLDYQKLSEVGMVRGTQEGFFDQVLVNGLNIGTGTVVVNLKGELIGIGMQGQLIAANDIKRAVNKIFAKAKNPPSFEDEKKKPWVGIYFTPINEDYATVKGFPKESMLVEAVIADSPADKNGMKEDDLIIEVDGQKLTKSGPQLAEQFNKYMDAEMNREITFKVLRGGETKIVKCKFEERPEPKEFKAEDIGLNVQNITDAEYRGWKLTRREGVLVTAVMPGSPAATAESANEYLIYQGDIIMEFNFMPINNLEDFIKAVETVRREKPNVVLVKLWRGTFQTMQALNLKIGRK
ncbi:MAG: PDZ domain-containing protein [Planctomycetes bacterium]|nr:PDZ domain-containing protein [Planctomycetota bacterium]